MTPNKTRKIWKKKARERRQRVAHQNVTNVLVTPSISDDNVHIPQGKFNRRVIAPKIKSDLATRQ